jgi:hypothetical protein
MISSPPQKVRTKHLPNTNLDQYRCANLLGRNKIISLWNMWIATETLPQRRNIPDGETSGLVMISAVFGVIQNTKMKSNNSLASTEHARWIQCKSKKKKMVKLSL